MRLAFWPGLGGGASSLAEIAPVLEERGIESVALDPRYGDRDDWGLSPQEAGLDLAEAAAEHDGYRWPSVEAYLDFARSTAPRWSERLETMALARFAELLPRGTIRHVESPHDVVWGLGPALGELVADWLAAEVTV
ncbi:MAG TPA: hypothetical protein VFK17_05780 [Gaiellaceae bacterium]|jgi:hypothetical protein|nr:hypothetical protein [Gaiellaceae bacterium]